MELPSHLQAIKRATMPLLQLRLDLGRGFQRVVTYGQIPRPLSLIHSQFDGLIAAGILDKSTDLKLEEVSPVKARFGTLIIQRSMAQLEVVLDGTKILFRTLPCLGEIVVVEPSDEKMINLFPGDTGDDVSAPEASQRLLRVNVDKGASFPCSVLGRPFNWAQWLGGVVSGNVRASGTVEPSSRLVALRLQCRFKSIAVLKQQLRVLTNRPCPPSIHCLENCLEKIAPGTNASRLCSWAVIAPPKDPFVSAEIPLGWDSLHCTYYKFLIKTEKNTKISVIVELSPEYPHRAPRFLLQPRSREGMYLASLKDAEVEVNANYHTLVDYQHSECHLLVHQLRNLQTMVDIIFNTTATTKQHRRRYLQGRSQKLG